MKQHLIYTVKSIAVVFTTAMLFFSCKDTYERVGEEAKTNIYPQGVAQNFTLTYTEARNEMKSDDLSSTKVIAVLTSPISEDFDNLRFRHRTFPKGMELHFFDDDNNKSIIKADYGIIYTTTNLIDLQGNVVIDTHDGKRMETAQLYWDRENEWIFTQEKFKFTNPEDGTVMDGEGMDFNRDLSIFKAHRTYGIKTFKEEE